MAIEKNFEMANGSVGSYWRIQEIRVVNGKNAICATIEFWKDRATRMSSEKEPMAIFTFLLDIANLEGDLVSKGYEALKLTEQLTGAIDV